MRNPRILLFGEATSALDSENEKLVQVALNDAQECCTVITISRRLSNIQKADDMLVMGDGQMIERGAHATLIKRRDSYYKLWQLCQLSFLI